MASKTALSSEDIKHAVLQSGVLGKSNHQKALFQFLLESDQPLDEYTIAQNVFQRDESFDPAQDSIVRSEMYRLRKNINTFNLGQSQKYGFRIKLPPRSFSLSWGDVSKPKKTHTNIGKKNVWRGVTILIVGSLMLGLGYFLFPHVQGTAESGITQSIAPRVHIRITHTDGHETSSNFLRNSISKRTVIEYVKLTQGSDFDYDITITILPDHRRAEISINTANGELVWASSYKNIDLNVPESVDTFSIWFFEELLRFDGVIPKHYTKGITGVSTRLELYRCYRDVLLHVNGKSPEFYKPTEFNDCLDVSKTTNPQDISDMHFIRAMILRDQYVGYYDYGIESSFDIFYAELERASDQGGEEPKFSDILLRAEWERPVRDYDKMRAIINLNNSRHVDRTDFQVAVAMTEGYILGDWEEGERVFRKINDIAGIKKRDLNNFLVARYIAADNYETAKTYLWHIEDLKISIYYALRLTVHCNLGEINKVKGLREDLKAVDIPDKEAYTKLIRSRRYHTSIENRLLDLDKCNTFDE